MASHLFGFNIVKCPTISQLKEAAVRHFVARDPSLAGLSFQLARGPVFSLLEEQTPTRMLSSDEYVVVFPNAQLSTWVIAQTAAQAASTSSPTAPPAPSQSSEKGVCPPPPMAGRPAENDHRLADIVEQCRTAEIVSLTSRCAAILIMIAQCIAAQCEQMQQLRVERDLALAEVKRLEVENNELQHLLQDSLSGCGVPCNLYSSAFSKARPTSLLDDA